MLAQERIEIHFDLPLRCRVAPLHRRAFDKAFDDFDREDTVLHVLRRHIGAHEQITVRAISVLDRIGNIVDVRERNILADQTRIKRSKTRRGSAMSHPRRECRSA